jgi:hypothetical protein
MAFIGHIRGRARTFRRLRPAEGFCEIHPVQARDGFLYKMMSTIAGQGRHGCRTVDHPSMEPALISNQTPLPPSLTVPSFSVISRRPFFPDSQVESEDMRACPASVSEWCSWGPS